MLEEEKCIRNNIKIVDQLGNKIRSSSEITGLNPK